MHTGVVPESAIDDALVLMLSQGRDESIPRLIRAVAAHFIFEYTHPFYDGNGRTGRYLLALDLRQVIAPYASLALSATVGCGFTAQLGAMRISEEIDALETMAVPSIPFLVSTRVIAGFIAVIPLYVLGLLSAYFASRVVTTVFNGQSGGSYDHYFNLLDRKSVV